MVSAQEGLLLAIFEPGSQMWRVWDDIRKLEELA